jgi:hypothetical protein
MDDDHVVGLEVHATPVASPVPVTDPCAISVVMDREAVSLQVTLPLTTSDPSGAIGDTDGTGRPISSGGTAGLNEMDVTAPTDKLGRFAAATTQAATCAQSMLSPLAEMTRATTNDVLNEPLWSVETAAMSLPSHSESEVTPDLHSAMTTSPLAAKPVPWISTC